jgi:hypothetical protein
VKVRALVQIFKERRTVPGNYYNCVPIAANNPSFEGAEVHNNNNNNNNNNDDDDDDDHHHPPINPNTFYKKFKTSIEEQLLSNDDSNFVNWTHILDTNSWPKNVALTFGEKKRYEIWRRGCS